MANPQVQVQESPAVKTLSVGCKLPNGLHLDLKTRGGEMERVTLKGSNAARIVGGYGITEGVSAEFFNEWMKRNAKHPAVTSGAIFAHADTASAESSAKEKRGNLTGLEPIDPTKSGVMKGIDGKLDQSALADYEKQKRENPTANKQQVVE